MSDLFGSDVENNALEPAKELNVLIASGRTKCAIEFLRKLSKEDVFEALARNRFTICGRVKKSIIDHVQNDLIKACELRQNINLV